MQAGLIPCASCTAESTNSLAESESRYGWQVSQSSMSWCQAHFGTLDQILLPVQRLWSGSCCPVSVGHSLWREAGSVLLSLCGHLYVHSLANILCWGCGWQVTNNSLYWLQGFGMEGKIIEVLGVEEVPYGWRICNFLSDQWRSMITKSREATLYTCI
jgi:hypothetical protein